jgi:hypothetical protein
MLNIYKFHTDPKTLNGYGDDNYLALALSIGNPRDRQEMIDNILAEPNGKQRLESSLRHVLDRNNGSIFKLTERPLWLGNRAPDALYVTYTDTNVLSIMYSIWGDKFVKKQIKKLDGDIVKAFNSGDYSSIDLSSVWSRLEPGDLPKTAKLLGALYNKLNSRENNKRLSALPRAEQDAAHSAHMNAIKQILDTMQRI